ncbi:hypothetical protein LIER_19115 [Lithospermum erythrorhizon]|uniref:Retrotransposon Copia-like N-terminal domain-containing protein n=1 Tax=Lithospermum erythrorhizon TaxID=34254 RepID=A0AAV3QGH6_LITER
MACYSNNGSKLDLSKLEPLNGKNYKCWSQNVLIFFEQIKVDYGFFNDPPAPISLVSNEASYPTIDAIVKKNEEDIKKYDKDNKTARYHILNHMVNNLFIFSSFINL